LKNVTFAYPKDPSRVILKNVSLRLNANQKNALVGESGCGKSTIMQLLMRFYDPLEGIITVDGIDIKQLKLSWLRSNIGYVGQEPVLFAATIKQNMLLGNPEASDESIVKALKRAEAYDFIMDLENKLDTYVGYGGGQLSGGQNQRIAIARAILKNPRILVLDEATSALDRKNEILIQNTLDKIVTDRTTISIAHRIKTIMNSDEIFVMHEGQLVEHGKFRDLNKFRGVSDVTENDEVSTSTVLKKVSENEVKIIVDQPALLM
jgi:ATP-binding cassette subfamily B (MDR/TAP) protein 1